MSSCQVWRRHTQLARIILYLTSIPIISIPTPKTKSLHSLIFFEIFFFQKGIEIQGIVSMNSPNMTCNKKNCLISKDILSESILYSCFQRNFLCKTNIEGINFILKIYIIQEINFTLSFIIVLPLLQGYFLPSGLTLGLIWLYSVNPLVLSG